MEENMLINIWKAELTIMKYLIIFMIFLFDRYNFLSCNNIIKNSESMVSYLQTKQ